MGEVVEIREFQQRDLDAIVEFSLRAWDPVFASLREVLGDPIFFRYFLEGMTGLTPDGPATLVLPVLGGTKNYANARGFVKVLAGRRTLLEFHLTP